MKQSTRKYADIRRELDTVLATLQDQAADIDEALALYKKGQALITELEAYLEKASNEIKALKPLRPGKR